ncbi:hypothetical protein DZF91_30125 [Actinomadura logoneensis]|uniref:Uncharacterized protein n=1 Tax=Actinomadura logoneensis TaxID=2293572 RepID=A0A372JD96_9ACTN|nr:hypothetical protein [Actinomadura logoneensis]RFU37962.1 hypothetical protein DZF91_30125 [Actinomadura logoneensis]
MYAAGGNPYGASAVTGPSGDDLRAEVLEAARYQGRRLALTAARLRLGAELATEFASELTAADEAESRSTSQVA